MPTKAETRAKKKLSQLQAQRELVQTAITEQHGIVKRFYGG